MLLVANRSAPPSPDTAPQAGLEGLTTYLAGDMARVDRLLQEHMDSPVPLIPLLGDHLINAGGKRIRPLLTLAAAGVLGYEGRHHIALAAAVEFIHTATLLHDDVVDDNTLRRGRKTANGIWGNTASVLVGDYLFSRAFQLMVTTGNMRVLDILARAAGVIAEGEVLQMAAQNNLALTQAQYMAVIKAKTAALFSAAAQAGGVIAGASQRTEAALYEFGENPGIAFQLLDDALDYQADQKKLGKSLGNDFQQGKITLPVILAYAQGSDAEKDFWKRTMVSHEQQPEDFSQALACLRKHNSLQATIDLGTAFQGAALDNLDVLPDHPLKQALADAARFVVARSH